MSISRRILNLARANLNALLERVVPDTPVGELTDEELEAELERRRARKRREEQERRAQEQARSTARDAARKRSSTATPHPPPRDGATRDASTRTGSTRDASTRTGSTRAGAGRSAPPPSRGFRSPEARIRECYTLLELQPGASFDEVKRAYRQLLRKYHPDLHIADERKHRAATELTVTITRAFQELEVHLGQRPAPQAQSPRR